MEQEFAGSGAVVNGVLGAASALTGFVLIFLSLALSTLQRTETSATAGQAFRWAAGLAFAAFVVGVAVIGLSLLWLRGGSDAVYSLLSWLFPVELLLVGMSAGIVTWKTVRRDPSR